MMTLRILHPRATEEMFGLIPHFIHEDNPAKAVEQLDNNYRHGGGWRPMKGFTLLEGDKLQYPGDPALTPLGEMTLRDERIVMYQYGFVAVIQKDGSFEAARMD
jgi:hypothetical protein